MEPIGIPAKPLKVEPAESIAEREMIDNDNTNNAMTILFIPTPKELLHLRNSLPQVQYPHDY